MVSFSIFFNDLLTIESKIFEEFLLRDFGHMKFAFEIP